MKFISIFTHEPTNRGPTEAEMGAMGKLVEDAMKEGWLLATEGVSFGQTGVRVHRSSAGKVTVTDGPFSEAKEVIGGYALLRAANKEEIVKLTRRFLDVAGQGTCEIYPLFEMPEGTKAAAGEHGVAVFAGQHQRGDARDLGFEGEHLQVEQQVHVVLEARGHADRWLRQLEIGRQLAVE